MPRASFIQIRDEYFGTIIRAGREDILREQGFTSPTRAVEYARQKIAPKPSAPIEVKTDDRPEVVKRWNEEKLARRKEDLHMRTLIGVEVVTKRRREVRHDHKQRHGAVQR